MVGGFVLVNGVFVSIAIWRCKERNKVRPTRELKSTSDYSIIGGMCEDCLLHASDKHT